MKITLGVIGKCKAGSPEGEIIARYAERMKWTLNTVSYTHLTLPTNREV